MTRVIKNIAEWQHIRHHLDASSVGFVPTMGALHRGHQELVLCSQRENSVTVVSIFVNPTQFNNPDDYQKYPRTYDQDVALLSDMKVDYVLMPDYASLFPDDYVFRISEHNISTLMEGKSRPGHFNGVLTVVMKLLNLVRPDRAYFGEKDYQQYLLIRNMCMAFFMPVDIVPVPTVRDDQGLAFSSRNVRLDATARIMAPRFAEILRQAVSAEEARKLLQECGFRVDYVEDHWGRRFGAVYAGPVRLIDNVVLEN